MRDAPASALIDGGNGFGAVVTARAMEIAIEKAAVVGSAVVLARPHEPLRRGRLLRNDGERAQGMVGIVMTNVTASMSATGGMTPVVGNNPIAFAVPSDGDDPV